MKSFKKVWPIAILVALTALVSLPFPVDAYVSVKGYYRSNGTYVAPHVRSNPNGLKYDNYSYKSGDSMYNKTYGTRGAEWDTPTYITDSNYYEGKALYESGSAGYTSSPSSYTPSYSYPSYGTGASAAAVTASSYESITGGYKSYGILFCNSGYYEKSGSCVSAPENGYTYGGTSFSCNVGYSKLGDSCVKDIPTCPANASYKSDGCYCINGFANLNGSCVTYNSYCQSKFGYDYSYLGGSSCVQQIPLPSCPSNATYKFAQKACICNDGLTNLNNSCVSNEYYCATKYGSDFYPVEGTCKKKEPPKTTLTVMSYIKSMVDYLPNESCESMGFAKVDDRNSCMIYKTLKNSAGVIWSVVN